MCRVKVQTCASSNADYHQDMPHPVVKRAYTLAGVSCAKSAYTLAGMSNVVTVCRGMRWYTMLVLKSALASY